MEKLNGIKYSYKYIYARHCFAQTVFHLLKAFRSMNERQRKQVTKFSSTVYRNNWICRWKRKKQKRTSIDDRPQEISAIDCH